MWRHIGRELRVAAILAGACGVAAMLLLPYLLALLPGLRELITIPLWAFAAAQGLQGGLVCGVMALVGLVLGRERGLGAPWISAWAHGRAAPLPRGAWRVVALGAGLGALILGLDHVFAPWLPAPIGAAPVSPAWWRGLLASFYGGIVEEVTTRLLVMTALVAAWQRLGRRPVASPRAYWFGIVAAALLFAALHLPAAAQLWPLTPVVVARVLVLNTIAGVPCGWLFWRHGLEAAMLAHFTADLVLHVLAAGAG